VYNTIREAAIEWRTGEAMLARIFRYKSIIKTVSSTEIYVFLILFLVAVIVAIVCTLYFRRKQIKASSEAMLRTFIRVQHLIPREADLLRELVAMAGFRRTLKSEAGFDRAIQVRMARLSERGLSREALADYERSYRDIRSKIRFLGQKKFTTRELPSGAVIKLRLRDRGLFTAEVEEITKKGFWVTLPYWVVPGGVVRKAVAAAVYFWDTRSDYEIHAIVAKVKGKKRPRLFFSHHNTVFKGRHPGGMGIETEVPVFFRYILDGPDKAGLRLRVLKGTIAGLSVIGCEVITAVKAVPGAVYRFEFSSGGPARARHWFIGKVLDVLPEGKESRLFIRFEEMKSSSRDFINRYVCWRVNRGGGRSAVLFLL